MIAAPYWGADEGWRWDDAALPTDAAAKLAGDWPLIFYHSRDDEIVPFAHLALYAAKLPRAIVRTFEGRGHQFGNDLSDVAADIARIWRSAAADRGAHRRLKPVIASVPAPAAPSRRRWRASRSSC